jgi:hypothetical protein
MATEPSPSTLLYLFGDRMFPPDPGAPRRVRVPSGAEVDATPLALNVLLAAVLNLRDDGLISVEPSGAPGPEEQQVGLGGFLARIKVGKASNCTVVAHETPERPSIEGRILKRAGKNGVGEPVELWKAVSAVLRSDEDNPWVKALDVCRDEARDLGLIEVKGLFRKTASADPAVLEPWVPQFERVVARLKRAESEEPELVKGIWDDCDTGLADRQSLARSV